MEMKMVFHAKAKIDNILFEGWNVTTVGGLVGSTLIVLLFALLYECLKSFIPYMNQRLTSTEETDPLLGGNSSSATARHKSFSVRFINATSHVLQVFSGYLLMLLGMTYNVWLFLAIVVGCGIGYFLFTPWKETVQKPKTGGLKGLRHYGTGLEPEERYRHASL